MPWTRTAPSPPGRPEPTRSTPRGPTEPRVVQARHVRLHAHRARMVIVFYVSGGTLPVPTLNSWNILIGFGIMFVGFLMTTRWR